VGLDGEGDCGPFPKESDEDNQAIIEVEDEHIDYPE
jgi:hypothetical protein